MNNPTGLRGIEFIEFAGPDPTALRQLFERFGFAMTMRHSTKPIEYMRQHDIHLLINADPTATATAFSRRHGPGIPAMGWRVDDAAKAMSVAMARGATSAVGDYRYDGRPLPCIKGIGDSLIYFVDDSSPPDERYGRLGFRSVGLPTSARTGMDFTAIDHLTNNVPRGEMQRWADFYRHVFGFEEVRYFDIKGVKTGLTSYALRSPCGSFCIPINEGKETNSQIDEYLREYRGAGVQHLAFLTDDIVASLESMQSSGIETLDIDAAYYDEVFERLPQVTEDRRKLRDLQILVDGDAQGYLLQIFTKNVVGPIFIEIIQRKNHDAFGEGNFGALFRSIERDQERRGVI